MKNFTILSTFLLFSFKIFSQETVVYIQALFEGSPQYLDSILVEDLTTKTNVMLTDLDINTTNYEINLSQLSGIECYDNAITLEINIPGFTRLNIDSENYGKVSLQIFDINGKSVIKEKSISFANTIDITIGKKGIYILRLQTAKEVFLYKLLGEQNTGKIDVVAYDNYRADILKSKEELLTLNYKEGDTVRLTVFATDFHGNLVEKIPENGDSYITYLSKPCDCGTVTDYEGNIYETVQIGNQCWMRQNLRSWRYANGITAGDIPYIQYSCTTHPLNYGVVDNGLSYLWGIVSERIVVSDTIPDIIQGICPNGWHVPSDDEWIELERYLGISEEELYFDGGRGTNQASMIKEPGTLHWISYDYNKESTNAIGFLILGCNIHEVDNVQAFWTSTIDHFVNSHGNEEPWPIFRIIHADDNKMYRGNSIAAIVRCVRCIKNNF
ncbi:MAG: T9SS type A sorting domain-containing protein [Bacteroidales bacterium]|jgi:uncharacterized protein (TIGR02145 family)|nr:T9SS type A sorting domain-containing protein [Bacteroidales bacterium]